MFGNKVIGFWVVKNTILFVQINRKTQKNTTTSLLQVVDNFILILLITFLEKH
jgi:hypothetical protein